MARVQLELNLPIEKLQLKAEPSTSLEMREQCTTVVTIAIAAVDNAVANCMQLFEQSFEVLTTLQEDPNLERLETEARELQQRYDEVKGTTLMVSLTQRLARMQQEKALKEQVDATRHKEAVLKACLQPWIDKAYTITASIESNLTQLQATQQRI